MTGRNKWEGPRRKKKKPEQLNKNWALRAQIQWATKRAENLAAMSKAAAEDRAYLFKMCRAMLVDFGALIWKLGDEPLSMFLSMLSTNLYNLETRELAKPTRKKKR